MFFLSKRCLFVFLCSFIVVIKVNAYENETFIVEPSDVCYSVLHQSVRHTMDGPFFHRMIPVSLSFSWMVLLMVRYFRPLFSRQLMLRLTRLQRSVL